MSKTNGNGHRDKPEDTGDRDSLGRFVDGNKIGQLGGRPPRIDIRAAAKKEAEKRGIDIEEALGRIMLRYIQEADDGDLKAALFVVDRLSQTELKGIEINATAIAGAAGQEGPDTPEGEEQVAYLQRMAQVLRELKLIKGG